MHRARTDSLYSGWKIKEGEKVGKRGKKWERNEYNLGSCQGAHVECEKIKNYMKSKINGVKCEYANQSQTHTLQINPFIK